MSDHHGRDRPTMPERYRRGDGSIDTERLKADTSIAAIAAEATELKRVGGELRGLCPLHAEETPSFFVNEAKGTYHCFGCAAGGDAVDLYARLHDANFVDSCLALAGGAETIGRRPTASPEEQAVRRVLAGQRAIREWRSAASVDGTLAETYLTQRGLGSNVPGSLRYSRTPRFWRNDGEDGPRRPAMLAAAQDWSGRVVGIQRTFLDGDGRKTRWGEPRLALGRIRGCALRVGPVRPEIMLATGTEDALALRLMFPGATSWAAFGDANLAHVEFPKPVRRVILCGDADEPGRAAVAAAREAFGRRGLDTDELFPRAGCKDFNEEWLLLHA